jgi:hypothetical protein
MAMRTTKTPPLTEAERLASRAEDRAYLADSRRGYFKEAIQTILTRLDDMATEVRRAEMRFTEQNASKTTEQIQHAILWGLANLNLDDLTRRAAEADHAVRDAADAKRAAEAAPTSAEVK